MHAVPKSAVISSYDIHEGSFDEQCERVRGHLRWEIALAREALVPSQAVSTVGDDSEAPRMHHHHSA